MSRLINMAMLKMVLNNVREEGVGVQKSITFVLYFYNINDKAEQIYLRGLLTRRVNIALTKERRALKEAPAKRRLGLAIGQARLQEMRFHQQNDEGDIISS